MTLTLSRSTFYNKHVLIVSTDDMRDRVPVAVVQAARALWRPDKKPGSEMIAYGQAKFVRSTPPPPDTAATLARRLRAMGHNVWR